MNKKGRKVLTTKPRQAQVHTGHGLITMEVTANIQIYKVHRIQSITNHVEQIQLMISDHCTYLAPPPPPSLAEPLS